MGIPTQQPERRRHRTHRHRSGWTKKFKRAYGITLAVVSVLAIVALVLVLHKPSVRETETSATSAKSFDQKLKELEDAHRLGIQREVHVTEAELSSKLQETILSTAASGQASLKSATVHLEGNRFQGTFAVNVGGKDVSLALGGTLSVDNGTLEFNPTDLRMGSLPVPRRLMESTLRAQLNSPQIRERLKLPPYIKDARIENGELVLVSQ